MVFRKPEKNDIDLQNGSQVLEKLVLLAIEESDGCFYILMMSAKFRMVRNYDIEASRTIAGALARSPWRCHVASGARKSAENR